MRLTLRAGEKIYVNGAVLSVDRKVGLEIMNDATFLLGSHVIQASEATTPLRRIYFAIQLTMMQPEDAARLMPEIERLFSGVCAAVAGASLQQEVLDARSLFQRSRLLDALKKLRAAFPREADLIGRSHNNPEPSHADH